MSNVNDNQLFTCRECGAILEVNQNLWDHERFTEIDDIEYSIVSNENNEVFAASLYCYCFEALKSELQPVEILSNDASQESASVTNQDTIDESIILAVEKRPALYDTKNVSAKDRNRLKKTTLWMQVAKELNQHLIEVKQRWEYLRNRYIKTRSKVLAYKPSGSAANSQNDPKDSFKFYYCMQFLNDSTDPILTKWGKGGVLQLFTCRECGAILEVSQNFWDHECFTEIDDIEYSIVSNENNELFAALKSESQSVELLSNDANQESTSVSNQNTIDESIILAVEKRPALYDTKNVSAKDRNRLKKTTLWMQVAKELNQDLTEVKQLWKYLRNRYIKTRSKVLAYKPSESAAKLQNDPKDSFKFYYCMQFLNDSTDPVRSGKISTTKQNKSGSRGRPRIILQDMKYKYKYVTDAKKNYHEDFGNKVLDILKENKPLDGVDGFLIQVGECMRRIPQSERLPVQIQILGFLNKKKNKQFNEDD
ncbi:hypothetical protein TSAR_000863 [Trichomalopsis sarcophagae]|uniref:MADF domain-containing protein n=1 Tax=Trichomalopsis sarcophagae TaxID=543379 RepID=A0A232ESP1_9HYME|nr:hypothetical protein TSAR_000863 [Trichomalopsis sarcophagae]